MLNSIENKMKLGLKIENHELISYMGTLTKRIEELNELKFPPIDELLLRPLEKMYPPLEYSPSSTKEDWIFRGGQRDVLNKLIETYKKQGGKYERNNR